MNTINIVYTNIIITILRPSMTSFKSYMYTYTYTYVHMASKGLEAEQESGDTSSQAKVVLKDPFVGNVSKLVPLPVDHKGPPMRGHLLFDACFEGGEPQSVAKTTKYSQTNYLFITMCRQSWSCGLYQ